MAGGGTRAARLTRARRAAALLGALALVSAARPGAQDAIGEYQVKAAYLFNFTQFIEWPEAAFADPAQPFRLCVWGDNPFGEGLLALQRRRYRERAIQVDFPADAAAAAQCQIVYLEGREGSVRERLGALEGRPLLTVGSIDGFAGGGGGVEFVLNGDKVRMTINLGVLRRNDLRVSAKLLEVALRVIDGGRGAAAP